jgi:predicted metal-binding membrane protein
MSPALESAAELLTKDEARRMYCVGCCWALMALLLVGGAMNVLWIVPLALLIVLEKVTPSGRLIAHLAGIVLVAGGAWLLATGMS